MPEPLPVEVVSDWWDYLVDGVGVLSGVATALALGVAALALKRQVDQDKQAQAAKVTMSISSDFADGTGAACRPN